MNENDARQAWAIAGAECPALCGLKAAGRLVQARNFILAAAESSLRRLPGDSVRTLDFCWALELGAEEWIKRHP